MTDFSHIIDLCSLSDTMPEIPENAITRDNYMDFFEEQLRDNNVLFIDADEGTGVTTTLAMFAQYHHYNCVSYFNSGLVKALLDPRIMEQSLVRQLMFFLDRNTILHDEDSERIAVRGLYMKIARKLRQTGQPLYFVFDGLNKIPREATDNIMGLMADMPWDKARFIFSGKYEELKEIMPKNIKYTADHQLQKFSRYEVQSFLQQFEPGLTEENCKGLYAISAGKGAVLQAMKEEFRKKGSFLPLLEYDEEDSGNIYEYNFRSIETSEYKEDALKVLALVAFSEIKLTRDAICRILGINIDLLTNVFQICKDYLVFKDNVVMYSNDSNHKFIRNKLKDLKHDMELLMVQAFQKEGNNIEAYSYMPVLLRSLDDKKGLVTYLNSTAVQKILEQKQSQAALNEQCEFGYNACDLSDISQAADAFRFALNKSTSREIEKNQLWDYQIDAFIAVGDYEKAYALAQSVFLKEERLKSLLIIARYKQKLPSGFMEAIDSDVDRLLGEIEFELIPRKSLELARLMFPYKFTAAVDIIDRVAKVSKNRLLIDKIYTLLSLSTGDDTGSGNQFNFDVVNAKIENESLRMMTKAVRSLFDDTDITHVISELDSLPSPQQRLHLLRFWIPEHKDAQEIGTIVKYAINTVISISNTDVPKASLVKDFCSALVNMNSIEIDQVAVMIDSVKDSFMAPSEDYVRLELLLIQAFFKYDPHRACDRLQDLYIHVISIKNKSTEINCKAIILEMYDELGNAREIEKSLMASFELQKEIEEDIRLLLMDTAYHIKVVESPLRSLVVHYPSSVERIIECINTKERKSRAYFIAASEYIKNVDEKKLDWRYVRKLIDKVDYDFGDRSSLVKDLVQLICHLDEVTDAIISMVKANHSMLLMVERSSDKCEILSQLFVWFKQHRPEDSYTGKLRNEMWQSWERINMPWMKVDIGYHIAKIVAKESMDDAKEMVRKSAKIQEQNFMASSSSVSAYLESINLYTRSLGLLIRSGICETSRIDQFSEIIGKLNSDGEEMIQWSRIALEYYLIGDHTKFKDVCNKQVVKNVDGYSEFYRKAVLFNISPSLYLYGQRLFYDTIGNDDEFFYNACIDRTAKFIFSKHPYIGSDDGQNHIYDLSYPDCEYLLDLLSHCTDDAIIFNITNSLCQSLKENRKNISSDQKRYIIEELSRVINKVLPTKNGIQHNGYKIACEISIWNANPSYQKLSDINAWEEEIQSINNKADRAFLYVHAAHYINKTDKRSEFISKAADIASQITSTYDRTNRMDMCISECIDTTKGSAKDIIKRAFSGLVTDANGKVDDYKRLIDLVYQFDPKLADQLIEEVDRDPARMYYKQQLMEFVASNKKMDDANKNLPSIRKMTCNEQMLYFAKKIGQQINRKLTPRDVGDTMVVLSKIFDFPITQVKDAIVFFLENIYQKNLVSHNQEGLLIKTHEAILFNLKIVLSLSSGTKEKLDRINLAISEKYRGHSPSFTSAGDYEKAAVYIKNWYKNHPFDNLMIMDAYFTPDQLFLIKELMNINTNLSVSIVTHRRNVSKLDEYQDGWKRVSSDLTGTVSIHTVCYERDKSSGPLHARWWLCINNEEDIKVGIKLTSISGFGKKDEDIAEIESDKIDDIEKLFFDYVFFKKRKSNDSILLYDTIDLT